MDNIDLAVLRRVASWIESGHHVVLGTITRTWGSAPRPVGSVVALRDDGRVYGSVSGGCIEDDLIEKIKSSLSSMTRPEIVRYGVGADEARRFGLPCGGTLELVLEHITKESKIAELLHELEHGKRMRRVLHLESGRLTLEPASGHDELTLTPQQLVTTYGPTWRLLIIGAGQMTDYLATFASALGYDVVVCEPREEYASEFETNEARLEMMMPDDFILNMKPDRHSAVVALSHDPKLDDLALLEAFNSRAFFIGAIGSRLNQERRRERLKKHFDITEEALSRLHGPVGIKNGARTPPEIAISILAEITAVRYGYYIPPPVPLFSPVESSAGCSA